MYKPVQILLILTNIQYQYTILAFQIHVKSELSACSLSIQISQGFGKPLWCATVVELQSLDPKPYSTRKLIGTSCHRPA